MKDPVELALGKQLDTGTEYAVLSHCWGLIPFMTLTQERPSYFMQDGIAEEILLANFLDAIWMCRQLQIRYLWIDSLCIIQSGDGSVVDWEEHVRLMGRIYSNSDLCIATAAAAGATDTSLK